jgi:hypothetical protein
LLNLATRMAGSGWENGWQFFFNQAGIMSGNGKGGESQR